MSMFGEQSQAVYVSIFNGKICRPVKTPTTKSVQRENKEKRIVNEEFYPSIEGYITDISVKEHKTYGKSWVIRLVKEKEVAILQMNYSSGYSSAFLKMLPNVDFNEMVKISPKMEEINGKKKTSLFLNQDDSPVKWAFTKENPGALPKMVKQKVKGIEQWDDSDMMEFLEKMVIDEIKPRIKAATIADIVPTTEQKEYAEDLPFEKEEIEKAPF